MPFEKWRKAVTQLTKEIQGAGGVVTGAFPSWPDPRNYKYGILSTIGAQAEQIPPKVSYRNNMPPVFDQGKYGTCIACAIARGMQEYHEMVQGDLPAEGLSPLFLYALCKKRDGIPDQEGSYPIVALKIMQEIGTCPESILKYSNIENGLPSAEKLESVKLYAMKYKIQTYAQICGFENKNREGTVEQIKRAIYKEGAVLAAVLVCANFLNPPGNVIPLPGGRMLGGHAVCLTGYDDERDAFELRNSWGTNWADGGYAWLPYDFVNHRTDMGWSFFEAWTSVDMLVYKPASEIVLQVGNRVAIVDGVNIMLDQPPVIAEKTGRTFVPIRFVGANMGYIVHFDKDTGRIKLIKPN